MTQNARLLTWYRVGRHLLKVTKLSVPMTGLNRGTKILPCGTRSNFSAPGYIKSKRVALMLLGRFYPNALISVPRHPNAVDVSKRHLEEVDKL